MNIVIFYFFYDVISGLGERKIIVLLLIFLINNRPKCLALVSFRSVKPFLKYGVTSGFKNGDENQRYLECI